MIVSLEEAVAGVHDGSSVYLGNFGAQLFSVGHELLRQDRRGLKLIVASGGILLDQLIAGDVAREVLTSHCWNPIGPEPAHHFVAAAKSDLVINELSFGALAAGLTASAWGVPFLPTTDLLATDYVTGDRSGGLLDVATSRLGSVPVVGAISPDVAFIHVDVATAAGNACLGQPAADATAAAWGSKRVILVTEELVDVLHGPAEIPGVVVDAVVVLPGAVRPDGAAGRYPRDLIAYADYARIGQNPSAAVAWRPANLNGAHT